MKRDTFGLIMITIAIIGIGSAVLSGSMTQVKGAVQDKLSGNLQMDGPAERKDTENITFPTGYDADIIEWEMDLDYTINEVVKTYVFYQGQLVSIEDSLLNRENAVQNAEKIMEFIFTYVEDMFLQPCAIDKTAYTYQIQRQYARQDCVYYSVFMNQNSKTKCSIGVYLDETPKLRCFSRDGLIHLAGGADCEIPDEFLEYNWSETTEKREAIYDAYLEQSKEIIAALGLAPVMEHIRDVNNSSYFSVGDSWSTVTFGYVLEDGTYVKVFYNRINGLWDGIVIAGYHKEYVD